MTLLDLYDAVSQLGFEDSLGDDAGSRFIYATNRALIEVDSIRPRRKRVDINHRVPKNLLFDQPKTIEKTDTLVFTAKGAKSFYFEVDGIGEYTVRMVKVVEVVEDGKKKEVIAYDTVIDSVESGIGTPSFNTFKSVKGFIKRNGAFIDKILKDQDEAIKENGGKKLDAFYTGDIEIVFEQGEYDYTIRNLAMYDRVYSPNEDDIVPYSKTVGYKMSDYVKDFAKFDTPPLDSNGAHLYEGYSIDGDTINLPIDKQGVYTINYLHKVDTFGVLEDIGAQSIDLDEDLAALLPNLIAAYVWLDDEPDKSQYYYNLYLARADQIKRTSNNLNPIEFKSVYGWC
jgi:hypothetical protein